MEKYKKIFLLVCGSIFLLGSLVGIISCNGNNNNIEILDVDEESTEKLIEGNYDFASTVFEKIIDSEMDGESSLNKNIFISPLSISIALTMAYNGAEGDTKTAMAETLQLQGIDIESVNKSYKNLLAILSQSNMGVKLDIANSIWCKKGIEFKELFLDTLNTYFNAEITSLDFSSPQAPDEINSWINSSTKGKIKKMINNIDPVTLMILINAIYFKGQWETQFDKDDTYEKDFTLTDDSVIQVPMMNMTKGKFRFLNRNDLKALRMPYGKEDKVSMYIVVPQHENTIYDLINKIDGEYLENIINEMAGCKMDYVSVPKFKIEYEKSMNDILKDMGMGIAYSDSADFSGIADISDLRITDVRHKAVVDVNEEGTEAAAVTTVTVGITSAAPQNIFEANRPFMFFIRDDENGTILFSGLLMNPLGK